MLHSICDISQLGCMQETPGRIIYHISHIILRMLRTMQYIYIYICTYMSYYNHFSHATYYIPYVIYHMSSIIYQASYVLYHISYVIDHRSQIIDDISCIIRHVYERSTVNLAVSCMIYQIHVYIYGPQWPPTETPATPWATAGAAVGPGGEREGGEGDRLGGDTNKYQTKPQHTRHRFGHQPGLYGSSGRTSTTFLHGNAFNYFVFSQIGKHNKC